VGRERISPKFDPLQVSWARDDIFFLLKNTQILNLSSRSIRKWGKEREWGGEGGGVWGYGGMLHKKKFES